MKKATIELVETLQDYKKAVKENNDFTNHWIRRFFRCWIDGSYKGEEHYKANCKYIKENKDNERKMKAFAINALLDFLETENAELSRSTIQKTIVNTFTTSELDALNNELIEDCKDLIRD